jgi:polyisoprenoid-binding protein YceI
MRILRWLALGLVVVVGVAFAGWYFFLKSDPEPRAAIKTTKTVAADASELDGTWTVVPGDARNFVGYRVQEKLVANIAESTATGRTSDVDATLTISGTTVSDVSVKADLSTLKSDQSFRDSRLGSSGLETDTFPEASFVATAPVTLPALPAVGETISVDVAGNLTLHGVTKPVTITLQGRWDGKEVQVVGSLPVAFSDYDITAPTAPVVASVDDHGELELQLFFTKA